MPSQQADAISKRIEVSCVTRRTLVNVSFSCPGNQVTAIVGPSGCGKSTLLRMMAGLEHADSGSVLLGGQAPKSRQAIGQIALAFQSPTLMPWRNVRQNIQLPLEILRHDGFAAVDRVLKLTELASIDLKLPSTLSGGQAQRVSLARALVTDPKFLLLDEPFTGLDFVLRRRLSEDLSKWLQELDTTTVLVTHDPREAVLLSDHIVVLSEPPT